MSAYDSKRCPLFSAMLSLATDNSGEPVMRRAIRRYISEREGDRMVRRREAIKGCMECARNLEKANCGRVFGREHKIAFQLNHVEKRDKESPCALTRLDLEVFATGSYKSKSGVVMDAPREMQEAVRARVESHAYQWKS